MKKSKLPFYLAMLALTTAFCVGCGKQTSNVENLSTTSNESEAVADATPSDEDITTENVTIEETEEENSFTIPDFDYDDYLTVSDTDTTPVLGFNIPEGWERINKSNTQRTLQKIGYSEDVDYDYGKQNIFILYGNDAIKQLNAIAAGEKPNYIEQEPVETPIGTFKTYIEQRDELSFTEYAFLPIDDTNGIYIFFSYVNGFRCHFYEDGMPALLTTLFNEKQESAPIPDIYEYSLSAYSYDGQTILGINAPDGYSGGYDEYFGGTDHLSFTSANGNNISILENPFIAPIYWGKTDNYYSGSSSLNEIYTYKSSVETIYGTVKIFDLTTINGNDTHYYEVAIIAYNGYNVEIKLYNYDTWENGYYNELEALLAQMF